MTCSKCRGTASNAKMLPCGHWCCPPCQLKAANARRNQKPGKKPNPATVCPTCANRNNSAGGSGGSGGGGAGGGACSGLIGADEMARFATDLAVAGERRRQRPLRLEDVCTQEQLRQTTQHKKMVMRQQQMVLAKLEEQHEKLLFMQRQRECVLAAWNEHRLAFPESTFDDDDDGGRREDREAGVPKDELRRLHRRRADLDRDADNGPSPSADRVDDDAREMWSLRQQMMQMLLRRTSDSRGDESVDRTTGGIVDRELQSLDRERRRHLFHPDAYRIEDPDADGKPNNETPNRQMDDVSMESDNESPNFPTVDVKERQQKPTPKRIGERPKEETSSYQPPTTYRQMEGDQSGAVCEALLEQPMDGDGEDESGQIPPSEDAVLGQESPGGETGQAGSRTIETLHFLASQAMTKLKLKM